MKTLLKLILGILIGLAATWLLVRENGVNWTSALILLSASVTMFIIWTVMRSSKGRKAATKVIVCFLSSTMAVSPILLVAGEGDTYAGYTGSSCYCLEPGGGNDFTASAGLPAQEPEVQNAVVMEFVVDATYGPIPLSTDATPRIVSVRRPDPSTLVSWAEIASTFAGEGIDLNAQNSTQYAKNGRPVAASEVPFLLNQSFSEKFTWQPDQPQYKVVVETTSDLSSEIVHWSAVARFSIPANTMVKYQDTPDGKNAFYRVRLDTTPVGEIQPAAGAIVVGCGLGLLAGAAYITVMTVRACAKNKKKFDALKTNSAPSQVQFNLVPAH